jgi:hypothetical protein
MSEIDPAAPGRRPRRRHLIPPRWLAVGLIEAETTDNGLGQ